MPRQTHPKTRHRHDRAHIRYHRDRVVKKRGRYYARYQQSGWICDRERERIAGPWGRNADEAWWFGCHRAGCGLCGYYDYDRARIEREAARFEEAAWR